MTPIVMQRFTKMGTKQKSNMGLNFGNQLKEILGQIDPDDVIIIGVYYKEIKKLQDNE